MSASSPPTTSERAAGRPPLAVRVGRVLFAHRGWIPAPLVAAMLLTGAQDLDPLRWCAGLALIVAGEAVRLAAVGHIGPASRTREDGAFRVVDTGPYAVVRNPLYLGNLCLWTGLGVVLWPWALVAPVLLGIEYAFIVRWEEHNLRRQLGAPYAAYCSRVDRWWPRRSAGLALGRWDGGMALRSERSTLLVISVALAAAGLRAVAVS